MNYLAIFLRFFVC